MNNRPTPHRHRHGLWLLLAALSFALLAGCGGDDDDSIQDADGDGSLDESDCAPEDPLIFPGSDDPFGDGVDQNCDGLDGIDNDGDGYPANALDASQRDCNDWDPDIHPGADDTLGDSIDNNCDGVDGVASTGDDDDSAAGVDDDSAAGDDDDSATGDDDDTATGDDDDSAPTSQLAIAGNWLDNWGTSHTITDTTWVQGAWGSYDISQFDNSTQVVIAQNSLGNSSGGGLWSRFDWHWEGSQAATFWYCQTCYDCANEAAALATAAADSSDPANAGCGGFSWTSILPAP